MVLGGVAIFVATLGGVVFAVVTLLVVLPFNA